MRKIKWTQEQVNKLVRLHGMFLRGEEGGKPADVEYGYFSGLDLSGVWLDGAILHGCTFVETNMDRAVLCGAELSDSEFFETTMRGATAVAANFCNCIMNDIDASNAVFRSANIVGSRLRDSMFEGSSFSNANMLGLCVVNCNFWNANLENAYLDFATVDGSASFRGATFSDSDMEAWKSVGAQLVNPMETDNRIEEATSILKKLSEDKLVSAIEYLNELSTY